MVPCPSCHRHLLNPSQPCPFCGAQRARSGRLPRRLAVFLTPTVLAACYGPPGGWKMDTWDTGGPDNFTHYWTDDTLNIVVTSGTTTYTLGVTQTAATAADPWTGEDCLSGDTLGDGTPVLYCHPLSATGGTFAGGGDPATLDEATSTVFTAADDGTLTFAAFADDGSGCWTWGADTSVYTAGGCVPL